jgi:hypothetical protein
MRSQQLTAIAAIAVSCGSAAFSQVVDMDQPVVNLVDGSVNVSTKFNLPIGIGPAQDPADVAALVTGGLAFYTAKYPAFGGFPLPFNIVGTDPSLGASTTTIPTVLVPLKFIFPNAGNPVLDGTNVVGATQNSPIFQTADYMAGSVDLGVTQYGDALQRGEFWNLRDSHPTITCFWARRPSPRPLPSSFPLEKGMPSRSAVADSWACWTTPISTRF